MKNDSPGHLTDYRNSHLASGGVYDDNLATSPFDAYMMEVERLYLEEIIKRVFPGGIPRYLDFACGTARITQTVSRSAVEVIGVDVSPSMLEQARIKCPKARFIQADLTKQSEDLGKFDLITSFRFFGNAQPELRGAVLKALSELIRPGGYLIINNHRNPNALASLFHRVTGGTMDMDLTHSMIKRMLTDNGFRLIEVRPIGAWLLRSRMLETVGKPDRRLLQREKRFGLSFLATIAPDAILVARFAP